MESQLPGKQAPTRSSPYKSNILRLNVKVKSLKKKLEENI